MWPWGGWVSTDDRFIASYVCTDRIRPGKVTGSSGLVTMVTCSVSTGITWVTATMQGTGTPGAVHNNERKHALAKRHMSTECRKAAGEAFSVEMLALVTLRRSVCWRLNPNTPLSFEISGYCFAALWDVLFVLSYTGFERFLCISPNV